MATRNIVPRADGEGSLGTNLKKWGAVYADDIAVTNGVTASTFTGDVTGDVTGTASGNLPLAGGTMTGDIVLSGATIKNVANDSSTLICGGTSDAAYGAYLRLHGKNSSSAGLWGIRADNGTNNATLTGRADGTLTWDGKNVERVQASGTGYIRYTSGLQMCWGTTTTNSAGFTKEVTFPQPFLSAPSGVVCTLGSLSTNPTTYAIQTKTLTTTSFVVGAGNGSSWVTGTVRWFAIGYWK